MANRLNAQVRCSEERWLSGRRRQTVNLLGNLTLVRIQLFSKITLHNFKRTHIKFSQNFASYVVFYREILQKYTTTQDATQVHSTNSNHSGAINHYELFFTYPSTILFRYFHTWLTFSQPRVTNLRLYFKLTKLHLNLESINPKFNLVSLTPGSLFTRFFDKKNLRGKKQLQTLLMRFTRKLLIFLNLRHLNLIVRGLPFNLLSLVRLLNTPISHTIKNPLKANQLFTDKSGVFRTHIWLIHFTKTMFFGKLKLKKKGRLKRKVARKILANNRLTD